MSATLTRRLDEALKPPSTAAYFDALTAADKAVSDANWNEMLARTARTPDTFMHCGVCGAEYTSHDDGIVLDDDDLAAAADWASTCYPPWVLSTLITSANPQLPAPAEVYARLVQVMVEGINYRRDAAEHRAQCDWHADHECCEADV